MNNEPIHSSFVSTSRSIDQPRTPQKSAGSPSVMYSPESLLTPVKLRPSMKDLLAKETVVKVTRFENRGKTIIQKRVPEVPQQHKTEDNIETLEAKFYDEEEFNMDSPLLKWCPFCSRETVSVIEYKNSPKTFWSAVGIFFMGGVLGCFMLPYMTNSCKEMHSVCSKCHHAL